MAYCPRCGVEVEERLENCPLCDTVIPAEVREHPDGGAEFPDSVITPSPAYRKLGEGEKRRLAALIIGFLALFPVILTAGIDLSRTGTITWSYFVIVPVCGAGAAAWLLFQFRRRPAAAVGFFLLILMAVNLLLELRIRGLFFDSPILPFVLVSSVAVEIFVLFAARRRRTPLTLIASALLISALLLCAVDLLIARGLGWSRITSAAILPVTLFLVYLARIRRRGINIVGFFFFDLTLMLLAIDLAIDGVIGWSIITSLIFLTIAALFYGLHLALLKDVDWRKALHL